MEWACSHLTLAENVLKHIIVEKITYSCRVSQLSLPISGLPAELDKRFRWLHQRNFKQSSGCFSEFIVECTFPIHFAMISSCFNESVPGNIGRRPSISVNIRYQNYKAIHLAQKKVTSKNRPNSPNINGIGIFIPAYQYLWCAIPSEEYRKNLRQHSKIFTSLSRIRSLLVCVFLSSEC